MHDTLTEEIEIARLKALRDYRILDVNNTHRPGRSVGTKAAAGRSGSTQCDPRALTILVVDDMAANCELVSLMLNKPERTIHTALSGKDAVKMVDDTDYDVILMDICMPDMNGFEAGRQILAKDSSVAVIALSADAAEEDVKTALEIGFADYMQKPVNRERLNSLLQRVIDPVSRPRV